MNNPTGKTFAEGGDVPLEAIDNGSWVWSHVGFTPADMPEDDDFDYLEDDEDGYYDDDNEDDDSLYEDDDTPYHDDDFADTYGIW